MGGEKLAFPAILARELGSPPRGRGKAQKVDVHGARLAPELIDQFVEVVTPFADYSYRWKLNTGCKKSKEERTNLMAVSEKPLLTFTIDFETAKRYREANKMPHQFRRAAWIDLTVEVYL